MPALTQHVIAGIFIILISISFVYALDEASYSFQSALNVAQYLIN
jgi:hypothetical protein